MIYVKTNFVFEDEITF